MANRAYLLNTRLLTNDPAHLAALAEAHGPMHVEVAEAAYRLPLPWLCCFRQSDLRPLSRHWETFDGEQGCDTVAMPCTTLAAAIENLKASLPLFEGVVGDARIARDYWQDALRALELLPLPFLTLDAAEVIDGRYEDFASALGGSPDAVPHLADFCGYDGDSQPFTLGEWSNLSAEDIAADEARRDNAVALDCAFGFGAPLDGAAAPYESPRRVFLQRGQAIDLAGLWRTGPLVASVHLDAPKSQRFGCYGLLLDGTGKPLSAGHAVCRERRRSPDCGIEFLGAASDRQDIRIDPARLPANAQRLILVMHREDASAGANHLRLILADGAEALVDFVVAGDALPPAETLLVAELRLDGDRRATVACQAYPHGIDRLLRHFALEPSPAPDCPEAELLRPGVNARWRRSFPSRVRADANHEARCGGATVEELDHYARHGDYRLHLERLSQITGKTEVEHDDEVDPPYASWEGKLSQGLRDYARSCRHRFEIRAIADQLFDGHLAVRAFAAAYTAEMIDAHGRELAPIRNYGRGWAFQEMEPMAYTAFGVVIGCLDQAFALARLQLAAAHRLPVRAWRNAAILRFMARLLAEYLDEPPPNWDGAESDEPILEALAIRWREPDAQALMPLCLAACDLHTHGDWLDDWSRIPVEMLLLFKLRQLRGLDIPELEHPLMDGALRHLPAAMDFAAIGRGPDDLLGRLRARMATDGYDEAAILRQPGLAQTVDALLTGVDLATPAVAAPAPVPPPRVKAMMSSHFGLLLRLPESWQLIDDGPTFLVQDPATGAELRAIGYQHFEVIPLRSWAHSRLLALHHREPGLRRLAVAHALACGPLTGISAEFGGRGPDGTDRRLLLLCLQAERVVLAVELSAPVAVFEQHQALYRWLLQTQLRAGSYPEEMRAFQGLRRRALRGDHESQYALAEKYFTGDGAQQDYQQARDWYCRAAEGGHDNAIFRLGCMYHDGIGVTEDLGQARAWFERGAEGDSPRCSYALGLMYYHGRGVAQDHGKAIEHLQSAAIFLPDAQYVVGFMLRHGQGTPPDPEEARSLYACAATPTLMSGPGNADAQCELGEMWESGEGGPQDYGQAAECYVQAAAQGHVVAQFRLGTLYQHGRGVSRDPAQALECYREAAAGGHAEAQALLAPKPWWKPW